MLTFAHVSWGEECEFYGADSSVFFRELWGGADKVLRRSGDGRRRYPLVAQPACQGPQRRLALSRHGALRTGRRAKHAGADLEHARRRRPLRIGGADLMAGY